MTQPDAIFHMVVAFIIGVIVCRWIHLEDRIVDLQNEALAPVSDSDEGKEK